MKIETITCKCGTVYAGCVEGYKDSEWRKSIQKARRLGHKIKIVENEQVTVQRCLCDHSEKEPYIPENQLSMF